ncbi:MAG: intermembrane transport protein PqiB [Acetobacteraceae bacterium]
MSPDESRFAEHQPDPGATSSRVAPEASGEPPAATEHVSRWPGWIWAIPIAALAIVVWLAFQQFASSGPIIQVTFPTTGGVQTGQTDVQYQGMKVGQVESVRLSKDLRHMRVSIQMDADMEGHLGKGTEFWIAGASPSLTDLSSLKSIISGPTIGMLPQPGPKQSSYQGLSEPPVEQEAEPGRHYSLHADRLGNVSRGSPVYFETLEIGNVEKATLTSDRSFDILIFIREPYDALVHTGTRFWNASAVQLSMQSDGPKLQLQGVPALLKGAIRLETPSGPEEGARATDYQVFTLYPSEDAAKYAPGPNAITYRVVFDASGGGLDAGAAVDLASKRVGTVESSTLVYDPAQGTLRELVTLAIEPSRITLADGATWPGEPRQQMDVFMQTMIGHGMRAQLGSAVPLVGAKDVELAFVSGATAATLIPGNPPEIPTRQGGGGIDSAIAAVSDVAGKIEALPLDQIGDNLRAITGRMAALSQSPKLTDALDKLDQSVANVEAITASAKTQVPQVIAELRRAATQAQAAVTAARSLLNNQSGVTATGVQTSGLSQTLYELTRAAQAIRQLADYLDQHPSALIRGRE